MKTMKAKTVTNLGPGFTCWLANFLVYKCSYDRSMAFKYAHAFNSFAKQFAKGIVEFTYMKDDGSIRQARGTLSNGVSDKFDEWKRRHAEKAEDKEKKSKKGPRENFTYWDLDKEDFRSFKAQNLLTGIL